MCNMNDSGHCAECKRNKSPLGEIVSEVACSAFTLKGSHTDLRNRKNRLWTEQFEASEDCGQWVIHLFSSIDPLFLVLLAKFSG